MWESLTPQQAFVKAVELAGGQSAFARLVGCTPGNIWQLLKKESLLPPAYVLAAEAGTGAPRWALRPDIYPSEQKRITHVDHPAPGTRHHFGPERAR